MKETKDGLSRGRAVRAAEAFLRRISRSFVSDGGVDVGTAIPVLALILAATAIPVELRPPAFNYHVPFSAFDVVFNVIAYAFVGISLGRRSALTAISIAAALSTFAEAVQMVSVERYASIIDVVCNVAGAALGVLLARRWGLGVSAVRIGRPAALLAAAAGVVGIVTLAAPAEEPNLKNWDPRAQVAVGQEIGRRTPVWQGQIHELAMMPGALDPQTIARLSNADSLAALPGASVFHPGKDLDLARLIGEPLLGAGEQASLWQSIVTHGAFTILLRMRTPEKGQRGGARIITYSRDGRRRNFTLSQERDALVFRVRTAGSWIRDRRSGLQTRAVLYGGEEAFVAATYDGAIARVFVNGVLAGRHNASAAGKPAPELSDTLLPAAVALIGVLAAIAAVGLATGGRLVCRRALAIVAGSGAGLLVWITGGSATLPDMAGWAPFFGMGGGCVVAAAILEKTSGSGARQVGTL